MRPRRAENYASASADGDVGRSIIVVANLDRLWTWGKKAHHGQCQDEGNVHHDRQEHFHSGFIGTIEAFPNRKIA